MSSNLITAYDTAGDENFINMAFITCITVTTVGNPTDNPCCGEVGDPLISVNLTSGHLIRIACNPDGKDITNQIVSAYKQWLAATWNSRRPNRDCPRGALNEL